LLSWLKKQTKEYDNVKVVDLTTSFNDGMLLCALIDSRNPNLINFKGLDPNNAVGNTKLAMKILETNFGVPKIMDAEDLTHDPDEKSVMTYVSLIIKQLDGLEKVPRDENIVGMLPGDEDKEQEEEKRLRELEEQELKRKQLEEEERKRK